MNDKITATSNNLMRRVKEKKAVDAREETGKEYRGLKRTRKDNWRPRSILNGRRRRTYVEVEEGRSMKEADSCKDPLTGRKSSLVGVLAQRKEEEGWRAKAKRGIKRCVSGASGR